MTTEILIPKLIKARKDLENFKKKHEYKILDEANIAGVMTIIRNEIDSLPLSPNCFKIPQKLDSMFNHALD